MDYFLEMDKSTWQAIASNIIGSGLVVGALNIVYERHFKSILQPLLRKRKVKISILCDQDERDIVRDFIENLSSRGYKDVEFTLAPEALIDRQIVIVWKPTDETITRQVETIQRVAPSAVILILSYTHLSIQRSEKVLLVNSKLRLLSDISVLAEGKL